METLGLAPFQTYASLLTFVTSTPSADVALTTPPMNFISALMIGGATHRKCGDQRSLSEIGALSDKTGSVVVIVTLPLLSW